jgi:hypothetical protein
VYCRLKETGKSKLNLNLLYYVSAKEVLASQRHNKIDFTKKEFFNLSYDYKSFLSSMLNIDWGERLSVVEALNHSWLKTIQPIMMFKKLTNVDYFSRTKTNQNLTSKLNIDFVNCLVAVARGTDKQFIKKRPCSISYRNSILRVSKTK